jgi:hypothetical protein
MTQRTPKGRLVGVEVWRREGSRLRDCSAEDLRNLLSGLSDGKSTCVEEAKSDGVKSRIAQRPIFQWKVAVVVVNRILTSKYLLVCVVVGRGVETEKGREICSGFSCQFRRQSDDAKR